MCASNSGGKIPNVSLVVSDCSCPRVPACGSRFSAPQTSEALAKARSAAMPDSFVLPQFPNAPPMMGLLGEELTLVSTGLLFLKQE